jgi:hypothetical protein
MKESVMGKPGISIGDDTPTGEPRNGPKGPYIDDETDDMTASAARSGQDPTRTRPGGSRTETKIAQESAIGNDTASADPAAGSGTRASGPLRTQSLSGGTPKPDMPDELAKRPKGPAQP